MGFAQFWSHRNDVGIKSQVLTPYLQNIFVLSNPIKIGWLTALKALLLLEGTFLSFSQIGNNFTKVKTPRVFNIFTDGFRILEAGYGLLETFVFDCLIFDFLNFGKIVNWIFLSSKICQKIKNSKIKVERFQQRGSSFQLYC